VAAPHPCERLPAAAAQPTISAGVPLEFESEFMQFTRDVELGTVIEGGTFGFARAMAPARTDIELLMGNRVAWARALLSGRHFTKVPLSVFNYSWEAIPSRHGLPGGAAYERTLELFY